MKIYGANMSLSRRRVDADFSLVLHIHSRRVSGAAIYCILYIFMMAYRGQGAPIFSRQLKVFSLDCSKWLYSRSAAPW